NGGGPPPPLGAGERLRPRVRSGAVPGRGKEEGRTGRTGSPDRSGGGRGDAEAGGGVRSPCSRPGKGCGGGGPVRSAVEPDGGRPKMGRLPPPVVQRFHPGFRGSASGGGRTAAEGRAPLHTGGHPGGQRGDGDRRSQHGRKDDGP